MHSLKNVRTLCRMAILTALYVILTTALTIRFGDVRITFASLPILLSAMLYGPGEAVTIALVGEFLNQLLGGYGITATTLLWIIPPAVRAAVVGLAANALWNTGCPLERRPAACYAACILGGMGTTVANTAVYWIDSLLYHYYTFAVVFGSFAWRLFTTMLTAVVVTTLAIPVAQFLRKQRFAREFL
jgi:ECF transporter S component (folate family)